MKKQILGFALVATSILTLGVTSHAALDATSEVGVGFEEESNTTNPTPEGARGSLSLQGVPTAFQFGNKHTLQNGLMTFPVVNQANATDERQLNVYDDRTEDGVEGKDNGWVLTGELSNLVAVDNDTAANLAGRLEFKMAQLKAYKATLPEGATSTTPLEFPKDAYTDNNSVTASSSATKGIDFIAANPAGVSQDVQLNMGGSEVQLFGVNDGAGNYKGGIVTNLIDPELVVTGGAVAETNYTGEVTWKLASSYTGTPVVDPEG